MIQPKSKLIVVDNSGASIVECIKVCNKSGRSVGNLGELLIVSIKKLRNKGNIKVKKKEISTALIFRTKFRKNRIDGRNFKFNRNTVILLSKSKKPLGTRIFGPVVKELRKQNQFKILSLASKFI
jgi:large subunit ribosomal protein L14